MNDGNDLEINFSEFSSLVIRYSPKKLSTQDLTVTLMFHVEVHMIGLKTATFTTNII